MYKVCAIGDADSVFGFASVGLDVLPAEDDARALQLLRDACKEGYAVILITERLARSLESEIAKHDSDVLPAIIPIPGVEGSVGLGLAGLSRFVEQAVGSDILRD